VRFRFSLDTLSPSKVHRGSSCQPVKPTSYSLVQSTCRLPHPTRHVELSTETFTPISVFVCSLDSSWDATFSAYPKFRMTLATWSARMCSRTRPELADLTSDNIYSARKISLAQKMDSKCSSESLHHDTPEGHCTDAATTRGLRSIRHFSLCHLQQSKQKDPGVDMHMTVWA
jgi:hypothetical protein